MKMLVQCIEGLESVTQKELKEESKIIQPGLINMDVKDQKTIAEFAMQTRSALGVFQYIAEGTASSLEDIANIMKEIDFNKLVDTSFVVRCERKGNHPFNSNEVERKCGEVIFNQAKVEVDLHNPKYTIAVLVYNERVYVAIDFAGFKLAKRDYRIKVISSSLNPCLAFSLLSLSEWNPEESLLDPFCKTGEIVIEAALFGLNIPPLLHVQEKFAFQRFLPIREKNIEKDKELQIYAYDSLHVNIRNAEVNAKLALVQKQVTFSRTEVEWLDTKFKEKSVDKIITAIPTPSRFNNYKDFTKLCRDFFHQVEFIIKKKGTITVMTTKPEEVIKQAELFKLKKQKDCTFKIGENRGYILIFKK